MPKEWAGRPVYEVSELVRLLASELEGAFPDVWVEGEIANWKRASSGHCYFTLKDERGALKTVMWRVSAQRLGFEPDNGMVVLARGKLSVYEASGDLQLYATVLEPSGLGALQMAFDQAKRRLSAEGLTDPDRRRPIPPFPRRVGVVTSLEGAALRDVLSVLRRRRAGFDLVIAPALVQGPAAPASLSAALKKLQRVAGVEVILLTRGGGSMQDLWAFNDEALARLVAASPVPVISAVGHEVDTVLTDLTADLRAPTPSVAAELLTAQTEAARARAEDAARRMIHTVQSRLFTVQERTGRCRTSRMGDLIARRLGMAQEGADRAAEAAARAMSFRLDADSHRLDLCRRSLTPEAFSRWLDGPDQRLRGLIPVENRRPSLPRRHRKPPFSARAHAPVSQSARRALPRIRGRVRRFGQTRHSDRSGGCGRPPLPGLFRRRTGLRRHLQSGFTPPARPHLPWRRPASEAIGGFHYSVFPAR
jgi:exodeoxyribonuclease VII large subunit